MKMHVVLLFLVTSVCLVGPAMAGPIPLGTPSGAGYISDSSGQLGFPGPDFWSTLHSSAPSNLGLSGSRGDALLATGSAGSDRLTGGGPLGPPTPAPIPEPNGVIVMLGSGMLGVVGLVRRKLRRN